MPLLVCLFFVLFMNPAWAQNGDVLTENLQDKSIDKTQVQSESKLPNQVYVDITADDISYNNDTSLYVADGNAETYFPDKDATLYADQITYDANKELLEAFGNIRIVQKDQIIYGTYASFRTDTNEYNLNEPKLYFNGLKLKARVLQSEYIAKKPGSKKGVKNYLNFKEGVAAFERPIKIYSQGSDVRTRYAIEQQTHNRRQDLEWKDLEDTGSLKYTAREIFYDHTSKTNNLRIKGARIWLNEHLSIPSPIEITTTVGEAANTRFVGPVIGTTERIGGFAVGPRFFHSVDWGTFSFVPVLQVGNGPKFGAGGIAYFNTPGDKTAIYAGYGSLYNRPILNAHQEFLKYFEVNSLVNQMNKNSIFGTSYLGQFHELASDFKLKLPFIDDRGMRIRGSFAWAKDNVELFSNKQRDQLQAEKGLGSAGEDHSGFRSELQTSFYTQPVMRYGNELYNVSLRGRGQGAARFYGGGDFLGIARMGPALEARIDNFSFEIDYLFAAITGESPFLFDQFVDGSSAVVFDGDYQVNRWFGVGTLLNYNLSRSEFTQNQVRAEFGPEDIKLRLSYDTIRNQIQIGFNAIFADPVKFDKLRVKI